MLNHPNKILLLGIFLAIAIFGWGCSKGVEKRENTPQTLANHGGGIPEQPVSEDPQPVSDPEPISQPKAVVDEQPPATNPQPVVKSDKALTPTVTPINTTPHSPPKTSQNIPLPESPSKQSIGQKQPKNEDNDTPLPDEKPKTPNTKKQKPPTDKLWPTDENNGIPLPDEGKKTPNTKKQKPPTDELWPTDENNGIPLPDEHKQQKKNKKQKKAEEDNLWPEDN